VGWTQEPLAPSAAEAAAADSIREHIEKLDAATGLDDATKAQIRDLLQQTLQDSEAIKKWAAEAEEHRGMASSATADAEKARRDLEQLRSAKLPSVTHDLSVADLRTRLTRRESELPRLRADATAAEEEPNRRNSRRLKIAQLLSELPPKAASAEVQLKAPPTAGEPAELTAARRTYLASHQRAIRGQIEALESERMAYDATVDLLPVRRRLAALELERAQLEITQLRYEIAQGQREDVA
jgi:hypothetical protein